VRLTDQAESVLARTPIQIFGLSLSVVLALGSIAVAIGRGADSDQEVRTTGAGPRTTTDTSPATVAASQSPPTSSPSPAGAPPTLAPPRSGSESAVPDPSDALVFIPGLGSPASPSSPQASPPPAPVALCTPAQVDETLVTDKAGYNEGEVVNVTATIVNKSQSICAVVDPDSNCYSLLSAYDAADNRPFWRSGNLPIVPCQVFPRRALVPGMSAQLTGAWDQSDRRGCSPYGNDPACTQPRVPGAYMIRSSWLAQVISTPVELL
jgi:hypothetical protein